MSSPYALTSAAIVSKLTAALGAVVRENETEQWVHIEADVPAGLGEAERLDLLTFLFKTADRFGHSLHKDGTSCIWAEVDHEDHKDQS